MDKEAYFLKALIEKYHPDSSIMDYLPAELKTRLESIHGTHHSVLELNLFNWVNEIHYSWLSPILQKLSPIEIQLVQRALTKKQKKGISEKALQEKNYSPLLNFFFRSYLAKKIENEEKDLTPPAFLPFSSLNLLLDFNKTELTHIIDYLGLFDLSMELKHIIDRELIEKIHRTLSPSELNFLKYISHQNDPSNPLKIGLPQWDGDSKSLRKILHQRGLYRFGKGLSNQNAQLIWHVTHRLDIGRGRAIYKILKSPATPTIVSYFQEQIIAICKLIRKA